MTGSQAWPNRSGHLLTIAKGTPTTARYLGTGAVATRSGRLSLVVILLLSSLLIPTEMSFYISTLRLTVYRVVLLVVAVPSLLAVLGGETGRRKPVDWLILGFCGWVIVSLSVIHDPFLGLQSGGINALECAGAFMVGRRYIRSPDSFRAVVQLLTGLVAFLALFTIPEAITGRHVIHNLSGLFGSSPFSPDIDTRFGLHRAFGSFEHPILYGTFCASMIGMSWFVLATDDRVRFMRLTRTTLVILASMMSVSSGAMAAIAVQLLAIGYERSTRWLQRRWLVLGIFLACIYVGIGFLSTRTPMRVILSYLTFSPETAFGRMVIWDKGTDAVLAHPLFGCGFHDWWDHPSWMSASMDNFWLVQAYRYGLPGGLAFAGATAYLLVAVGRVRLHSEMLSRYRTGWMVSMIGLTIAGATVHFWNSMFVLFCFLLGAGVWFLDDRQRY